MNFSNDCLLIPLCMKAERTSTLDNIMNNTTPLQLNKTRLQRNLQCEWKSQFQHVLLILDHFKLRSNWEEISKRLTRLWMYIFLLGAVIIYTAKQISMGIFMKVCFYVVRCVIRVFILGMSYALFIFRNDYKIPSPHLWWNGIHSNVRES